MLDTVGSREIFEGFESVWRWIILLAAVGAIGSGALASTGRVSLHLQDRFGLAYLLALGVGVALGLVDWALHVLGGVKMGVFFTAVHPLAMLAALGLVYFTRRRAGRAADPSRARFAALGYLASLVIITLAMPGVLFRGGILGNLF